MLDLREEEVYARSLTGQMEWKGFIDCTYREMAKKTNLIDSQV